MKRIINIAVTTSLAALLGMGAVSCGKKDAEQEVPSTKRERNFIKEGNELYGKQRYAEAEVAYKKALQENPDNATAQFNLASSYLKQRGEDIANKNDSLVRTADAMLAKVASAPDRALQESASYDRGNVAYKAEDYASAIEQYKNALRRNPDNDQARENLRLAQLKKQEQDQQNQNQDQNQDQQNKDQNQDKQDKQQNQDQQNQQ
ncbi:MAG: tetratricopeptide repeat protein, partial [Muribaculaceae bacterium]|nr:tetratricopeptide repeat protein [Muribaculaceae bacterium]